MQCSIKTMQNLANCAASLWKWLHIPLNLVDIKGKEYFIPIVCLYQIQLRIGIKDETALWNWEKRRRTRLKS